MGLDSQANEFLADGYTEYEAGFMERVTGRGSVHDAFKYWGDRVVEA
jgi:hypothetical protein